MKILKNMAVKTRFLDNINEDVNLDDFNMFPDKF